MLWSPEEIHIEQVKRDIECFSSLLPAVDDFILKGILPEVTAHWFSQMALIDNSDTADVSDSTEITGTNSSQTDNTVNKEMFSVCNGPDDERRMVLCENEHCSSGTWFYFDCLNITRKPRGKWFCPDCKTKKYS